MREYNFYGGTGLSGRRVFERELVDLPRRADDIVDFQQHPGTSGPVTN